MKYEQGGGGEFQWLGGWVSGILTQVRAGSRGRKCVCSGMGVGSSVGPGNALNDCPRAEKSHVLGLALQMRVGGGGDTLR